MARIFPVEHWKRKAIIVVSQSEFLQCQYDREATPEFLYNPETFIMGFPPSREVSSNSLVQGLLDGGLIRPNVILTQNPYRRDSYANISDAHQQFSVCKQMKFIELCKLLGACAVDVEQIEVQDKYGKNAWNIGMDASLNHPITDLILDVDNTVHSSISRLKEELTSLRSKLQLKAKFAGSQPDFDEARRVLEMAGLSNDATMSGLIQVVGNSITNRNHSIELLLSLTKEYKQYVTTLGNLKIPAFIKLEFEGDYGKLIHDISDYTIKAKVIFKE